MHKLSKTELNSVYGIDSNIILLPLTKRGLAFLESLIESNMIFLDDIDDVIIDTYNTIRDTLRGV